MPAKTGIKVSPKPNKEAVQITTEGAVKHIRELLAANGSVQNPVYVRMLLDDYDARGKTIADLTEKLCTQVFGLDKPIIELGLGSALDLS